MKQRRIIKRERALDDLERRSEYLRQYNPRAALRFLDAAEAEFRRLALMPGLGTRYDREHSVLADLCFFPLTHFNDVFVFYRPLPDGIDVVRVLHAAQDIRSILADETDAIEEARRHSLLAARQSGEAETVVFIDEAADSDDPE